MGNRGNTSTSKSLRPGTVIVHKPTSTTITLSHRKPDGSGWWNTDGSGFADAVLDGSSDFTVSPRLSVSVSAEFDAIVRTWPTVTRSEYAEHRPGEVVAYMPTDEQVRELRAWVIGSANPQDHPE